MKRLLILLLIFFCSPVYSDTDALEPLFASILSDITIQDVLDIVDSFQLFFKADNFSDFKQKLENEEVNLFKKLTQFRESLDLEVAAISEQAKDFSDRVILELTQFLPPSSNILFDAVSVEAHLNDISDMYTSLDTPTKTGIEKISPSIKFLLDSFSSQMKDIHMYMKNPLLAVSDLAS